MTNDARRWRVGLVVLGICLVGLAAAQSTQPQESVVPAMKQPLETNWVFRLDRDDVGVAEKWYARPIDGEWTPIRVPGHWEDQGFREHDGVAWYACEFVPPPPHPDRRRALALLGVDDEASVWINGTAVPPGRRLGQRYAAFIDEVVRSGSNALRVRVRDTGGAGGITRPVLVGSVGELDELLVGEHAGKAARRSPEWVRDAVIYCAYLRSASREGTLRGLEARLDEIRDLGATIVWLLPIHPVGEKHRKGTLGSPYSVRDYHAVNPEFGTLDDFKSLLAAAHARDLRVIIDLVANHTAWDNPLVRAHPDWYTHDAAGRMVSPVPDWSDVAQLDFRQPALRRWMADMLLFWVRDVGIDGFRCDVAGMVPLDFWETVRPKLDAARPVLMLAEDDNPAQHLASFDLTYDWATYDALESLAAGKVSPAALVDVLALESLDFPRGSLRMRFIDNHDKNAWVEPAIKRYGVQGKRLAALLTYVLPGVPLIYNGQEVAAPEVLHLFERVPVDYGRDPHEFRKFYRELSALRRELEPLRRGDARAALVDAAPGVLRIERRSGEQVALALLNLSDQPARVPIETSIRVYWQTGQVSVSPSGVELGGLSGVVLVATTP